MDWRSRARFRTTKPRVVLAQLAHALNDRNHWFCNKENVPLAAGYMRALARSRGLDDRFEISILEPELADYAGDAALAATLVRSEIDVLALSLYPWNLTRSLSVAAAVRRRRPDLLVVAGGPEVNDVTIPDQLAEGWVDVAIPGEGESTFCAVLEALSQNRDLASVPGVVVQSGDQIVRSERRATLVDLDGIPSPFVEGDIDARHYRQVHVLFERGCIYACNYCHWWPEKRSRGKFSVERIHRELEVLRACRVQEVVLLDAAINTSKRFDELTDLLMRINGDGKLQIKVQVLFDHLNRDQVERLASGGVRKLELGLQSSDPNTLKAAQRPTDLSLLEHALELCDGLPIDLQVDFIMGLPGDSADGVRHTARRIRDLCRGKRLGQVSPFVLSIGSATQLRTKVHELDIEFQGEPPYRVLRVGQLDYATLRQLRMDIPRELGGGTHPMFDFDRTHYAVNLFEPELATFVSRHASGQSGGDWLEEGETATDRPLDADATSRIDAVSIRCDRTDPQHTHPFAVETVSARLAQLAQVRFVSDYPEMCVSHMAETLAAVSGPNPYTVWDLVLETGGEFDVDIIRVLCSAIRHRVHNLDWDSYLVNPTPGAGWARVATRPFVVVPLGAVSEGWLRDIAPQVPIVHAVTITGERDAKQKLKEVARLPGEGVLVDVMVGAERDAVHGVLTHMSRLDRRVRRFRNLSLEALFASKVAKRRGAAAPRTPYADRAVVQAGTSGGAIERALTHRKTMLDVTHLCLALHGSETASTGRSLEGRGGLGRAIQLTP